MIGPVRYMAENRVAANLLMLVFLVGGALATSFLTVEVFPEVDLDRIYVSVPYPGAAPGEVEEGVIEPIEEAVQGVDGVRRVQSTAVEGHGSVIVELLEGHDVDIALQDVKAAVDRIVTFPNEIERPLVNKLTNRRAVLSVVVYGDLQPHVLREHVERVRDGLLALPNVTQADLSGVPNPEISIEIKEETLRRYGLTLGRVATAVRQGAIDLPGGTVKTESGDILLRTKERRYHGREYADIVVVSKPDGTLVQLGDIANIRDTFEETDEHATFNGLPAGIIDVYRVGDQSPTGISKAVHAYLDQQRQQLPSTVQFAVWNDRSEILESRLSLLTRNALLGLILVMIVLGMFLRLSLAMWVTLGIPVAIFGGLLFAPYFDVTVNMISLFAFILVLGIVVDDAIVVGENAYTHRGFTSSNLDAAVDGAKEVGLPVTFSVLTTVAAFLPLLFVSGTMGKFMRSVPLIVIPVLLVSLVESLFVLPSHLSHGTPSRDRTPRAIVWIQTRMAALLAWVIEHPYTTTLRWALTYRYTTVAVAAVSLAVTVALFATGHIKMIFMPELEGDVVRGQLAMPFGTPAAITEAELARMVKAAQGVVAEEDRASRGGHGNNLRGVFSIVGRHLQGGGPPTVEGTGGSHLGEVAVFLQDADTRTIDPSELARRWRERVGEIPGAEELEFDARLIHIGAPIGVQLAHQSFEVLEAASARLKARLREYSGLYDVKDSYEQGKRELKLRLEPEARSLGITARDLADQVRASFYGAEALRLQRGRNEVKVMVRYPREERRSLADVASMRIRTSDGGEVPFAEAAEIDEGRGYSVIERTDRKRTVTVSANANLKVANVDQILAELKGSLLPQLINDYPGLSFDLEGEQRERAESMRSLGFGFVAALGLIFALLAIPFRSYSQPLIIMSAVPFGIIGAVLGHVMLGYNLSLMSMFGLVALTGVVVNDSLVLIDFINRSRVGALPNQEQTSAALSLRSALIEACKRRFRPILLTTLTTFFALVPMISETSVQARFLVPMAISLAFGVLFSTAITLILIPTLYMVLEDMKHGARWLLGRPE